LISSKTFLSSQQQAVNHVFSLKLKSGSFICLPCLVGTLKPKFVRYTWARKQYSRNEEDKGNNPHFMKNGQVWLLLLFIQIYEPLTRNPLDGQ